MFPLTNYKAPAFRKQQNTVASSKEPARVILGTLPSLDECHQAPGMFVGQTNERVGNLVSPPAQVPELGSTGI